MENKLDWSEYSERGMGDAYADIPRQGGDFAKAVAVCIQSGHCERNDRGVMCPSFRISQEPDQSPGGRVRLLKNFLNHYPEHDPVETARLDKAMDSCVACKGCKRECENNLDIAQIKAEYLAHQQAQQSLPLRDRLFAELPRLLYRYPQLRALILLRNRSKTIAKLMEKWLGISARIALPELARQPFHPDRQAYYPYTTGTDQPNRSVVLLIDPFTALFRPEHAEDALHVLRSAGYTVWPIHPLSSQSRNILDSGRTQYSKGQIDAARQQARQLLDTLTIHVRFNRPIIGLEPSALLMLRDEFLTLGLGEQAEETAKLAILFEEFLAKESKRKTLDLTFKTPQDKKPVMVHGHCHQKAVGAMKSVRRILKLIPELQFEIIDSSCCGMAGTFGLEAEHIDQAWAMAQQDLVPALNQQPQAKVICNGFACSYQIELLTGRQPLHLASLLAPLIERS